MNNQSEDQNQSSGNFDAGPVRQRKMSLAEALQRGAKLHEAGRLDEAEQVYRQIIAAAPDHHMAICFLGVIAHQRGKHDDAIELFERALSIEPKNAGAHNRLGGLKLAQGEENAAIAHFRKAIKIAPRHLEARCNLGAALVRVGDDAAALQEFNFILSRNPSYANALVGAGQAKRALGDLEGAIDCFERTLALDPNNVLALSNLGDIHQITRNPETALNYYDKGMNIDSSNAELHAKKARVLVDCDRIPEAEQYFIKALELDAECQLAHIYYLSFLDHANRISDLRSAISEAKSAGVASAHITLYKAKLLFRDNDFEVARAALEALEIPATDYSLRKSCFETLGKICDRMGAGDAAFRYFAESNETQKRDPLAARCSTARHFERLEAYSNALHCEGVSRWRSLAISDARRDPAFLFSFPRSGTTLVDSMLRGHREIATTEEQDFINTISLELESSRTGYAEALETLSDDDCGRMRNQYFENIAKIMTRGELDAPILIDRHPLHTQQIAVIHRIFPEAPLIFVARHPCDCLLSCFMQSFNLTDQLACFLDLETSVQLYDKVMSMWTDCQSLLPLRTYTVQYEDLVGDAEGALRPLLTFLGAQWDENILNHSQTAKSRSMIKTASYAQVTQPIYSHAVGRWKRYRKQLKPALPTLLKWADRFGYEN